jgi:hypothetical protein
MTQKIRKLLKKLNIAPNLSGYFYLMDAIEMVYENKEDYINATIELYSDVARKYNHTMPNVERGIRTAISKMDIELFKQIFKYNGKVNNRVFIYMVADELDEIEVEE